jgi:hypothetical protein
MPSDVDKIVGELFKRGFNPHGVIYVLRLLAAENPEGSARGLQLEAAAQHFLE